HVTTTGTAVSAVSRDTWGTTDLPVPELPPPDAVPPLGIRRGRAEWVQRYEMRPIIGSIPSEGDGKGGASETRMWLRDDEPRPLDFAALMAMSDCFFPRVWLRRANPVPIGTVSIT